MLNEDLHTEHFIIYELRQVIADPQPDGRRYVHVEPMGLYDSLETAEAALRSHIRERKEHLTPRDLKHYYHCCIEYQLLERAVLKQPNIEDDFGGCRTYNADGELKQDDLNG